jgi:hypothetical protein
MASHEQRILLPPKSGGGREGGHARGFLLATVTSLALTTLAFAPSAHADDRSSALTILVTLEHAPVGATLAKEPGSASQLAPSDDAVTRARDALERATRMRNAGDEAHARLAEGLALEWAETARDRARTLAVETKAREAEVLTIEATARVERERALLEEAIARSGRLKAEVALATKKASPEKKREHTSMAATNDVVVKPKGAHPGKGGPGGPPPATPGAKDADAPSHEETAPTQGTR